MEGRGVATNVVNNRLQVIVGWTIVADIDLKRDRVARLSNGYPIGPRRSNVPNELIIESDFTIAITLRQRMQPDHDTVLLAHADIGDRYTYAGVDNNLECKVSVQKVPCIPAQKDTLFVDPLTTEILGEIK